MQTWLEVHREGVLGDPERLELDGREQVVIGRAADCDVVLLVEAVSRRHARVFRENGGPWSVEDLGSRNGTRLNERLLDGPAALEEGDRIRVGSRELVFRAFEQQLLGRGGAASPVDLTLDVALGSGGGGDIVSTMQVLDPERGGAKTVDPQKALGAVLAINRQLGGRLDLDEILPKVLEQLFEIYPQADCGVVLLDDASSAARAPEAGVLLAGDTHASQQAGPRVADLRVRAVRRRRQGDAAPVRISRTILETAVARREAILSRDASSDADFEMSSSLMDLPIRSVMCVPLIGREGRVLGVVQIHTEDATRAFGEDALRVLVSVCQAATIAIENALLHGRVVQQQRIERDLDIARHVQRSFVPQCPPDVDGYRCTTLYRPAYTVGGDLLTFVPLDDRAGFVVGDVSGKGISAALLMARLTSDARFALWSDPDPSVAMRHLDDLLLQNHLDDRFVTMILGTLEPQRHLLRFGNGGHPSPMRWRAVDGVVDLLGVDAVGLPLTVQEQGVGEWPTTEVQVEPGDAVLFYTDGIDEARGEGGRMFGKDAIRDVLAEARGEPHAFARILRERLDAFTDGQAQNDDLTFFVFQRVP
jgi:sigma-B regulation protein RsbU (phosphoserine phosphatase)